MRDVVGGNVGTPSYRLFTNRNSRTARFLLRRDSERSVDRDYKDCCKRVIAQTEGIDGPKNRDESMNEWMLEDEFCSGN